MTARKPATPKPTADPFAAQRDAAATWLHRRVFKHASITLTSREARMLIQVLRAKPRAGRPRDALVNQRDWQIAAHFLALRPEPPRVRGWKSALVAQLAELYQCDDRMVRRAIDRWSPQLEMGARKVPIKMDTNSA